VREVKLHIFIAACISASLVSGCGSEEPHRPAAAKVTMRERDSVIAQCRDLLASRPGDADIHSLLGTTLLEKSLAGGRQDGRPFLIDVFSYGVSLNDIGLPLDSVSSLWQDTLIHMISSEFAAALRLNPRSAAAWRGLALLDFTLAMGASADSLVDTSAVYYLRSIAFDSNSTEAYVGFANCMLRRHNDAEALAALQASLRRDSTSGSVYLTMGNVYADSGNIPLAFACWENAVRLGLQDPGDYVEIARNYTYPVLEEKLLGRFASLRTEGPGIVRPLVRGALKLIGMYHPAIALRIAGLAIQADSANAQAHLFRARIELSEGDTASARGDLSAALAGGTAPFYSYSGYPPRLLQEAAGAVPYRPRFSLLIGSRIQSASGPAAAIGPLRRTISELPGNPAAAFLLGSALIANGDTAEALAWFDTALSGPTSVYPMMYWDLSRRYIDAGDISRVVRANERQMEFSRTQWTLQLFDQEPLTPRYDWSLVRLAAAHCEAAYQCTWSMGIRDRERARRMATELFRRAHTLIPTSAVPYLGLGDLNLDEGNRNEALQYYRLAAAKGSRDATEKLKRFAVDN